ncbi:hypothetical protein AYI68_g7645 [Smittium mucronatum]|uniref:Uncharacterized protein n=1 Tax=Smittium mucronatum TaxID=133383 RepID=A0A1R0GN67_9FUNG|nr:hypothetical protein AYI68_g7645 [Smittium mucronatum]
MSFLQIADRCRDHSDRRTLDLCTRLCLSCAKRSVPPVSRWSSSGIAVLRIAVRYLHYSQPRIVQRCALSPLLPTKNSTTLCEILV